MLFSRHRILRHTAELHVQPSLQLHVVTSRGSHHSGTTQSSDRSPNAGSVSLLLEVKNVNSVSIKLIFVGSNNK